MPCLFQFGFRKWKAHVTEKPIEDRSDIIKELYSDLSVVKPQEGLLLSFRSLNFHSVAAYRKAITHACYLSSLSGSVITFGNIIYVLLFGWWISLIYFLICPVMFLTIIGAAYGTYPVHQLHHVICLLYILSVVLIMYLFKVSLSFLKSAP